MFFLLAAAVTVSFTQRDGSIENFKKNDAAQYCDTNAQKSSDEEIFHKLAGWEPLKFWGNFELSIFAAGI